MDKFKNTNNKSRFGTETSLKSSKGGLANKYGVSKGNKQYEEDPEEKKGKYKLDTKMHKKNKKDTDIYSVPKMRKLERVQITALAFGILSADEIRKIAVTKIVSSEMNENKPAIGNLYDPYLGSIDANVKCATCHLDRLDCPGHFGYMEVNEPFLHPWFKDVVTNILRCFCRDSSCYRLLLDPEEIEASYKNYKGEARLKAIASDNRLSCSKHSFAKYKETETGISFAYTKDFMSLTIEEIMQTLQSISNEDCAIIGLNNIRPENFVITVLPVLPTCARPYHIVDGSTNHDSLTYMYKNMLDANTAILNSTGPDRDEKIALLVSLFASFIDNSSGKCGSSQSQPYLTMKGRIDKKDGVMRYFIQGKRGDFSARTVIIPDPHIDVDQVGLPEAWRKTLTVPLQVTEWNIDKVRDMIYADSPLIKSLVKGHGKHAGVKKIISTMKLEKRLKIDISVGDKVNRFLQDDDVVIFNRQPTLHKQSMMAHRVFFKPGDSIRLNPSVTTPYNADLPKLWRLLLF